MEILLADWIPRKIVASPEQLSKAPALLRAFIRFCHAEREIRAALTDDTLAAVDEWEPEYQWVIRSSRPQGPMALLAAMGVLGERDRGKTSRRARAAAGLGKFWVRVGLRRPPDVWLVEGITTTEGH